MRTLLDDPARAAPPAGPAEPAWNATRSCSTGPPSGYGGLAFDPGDGTLHHASGTSSSKLSTVVPGTGAATDVGPTGVAHGIWGLAFASEPTPTRQETWGRIKALYR